MKAADGRLRPFCDGTANTARLIFFCPFGESKSVLVRETRKRNSSDLCRENPKHVNITRAPLGGAFIIVALVIAVAIMALNKRTENLNFIVGPKCGDVGERIFFFLRPAGFARLSSNIPSTLSPLSFVSNIRRPKN